MAEPGAETFRWLFIETCLVSSEHQDVNGPDSPSCVPPMPGAGPEDECPLAMDCSLPGSSVHAIPQARILEWFAIPFSRISS